MLIIKFIFRQGTHVAKDEKAKKRVVFKGQDDKQFLFDPTRHAVWTCNVTRRKRRVVMPHPDSRSRSVFLVAHAPRSLSRL